MKQIIFCLFIWTQLSFGALFGQEHTHKKIVILDPGHGGADAGAVSINGLKEKEVVWKIAMEVLRLNRELYNDTLAIYSTRYRDTLIALHHRTLLAKRLQPDAFVSIHCNHAKRAKVQGIEVYVGVESTNDSERLALLFANGLNQKLGFKNRGVKQADFQVIKDSANYPTVLLELGFLSNPQEAAHFGKATSIRAHALLILETLLSFLYDD